MSTPWPVQVLDAFAAVMATAPDIVAATAAAPYVGWPSAGFLKNHRWRAYVWFEVDDIAVDDGTSHHRMVVVTGIVFAQDKGDTDNSELKQALAAYFAMRDLVAAAADTPDSAFNQAFVGHAMPAGQDQGGGVKPSDTDDFDGTCIVGERWIVQGSPAPGS